MPPSRMAVIPSSLSAGGSGGLVLGIDIQPSSIESTRQRLEDGNLLDRSVLVQADHRFLDDIVRAHAPGRSAAAVMFNLGYLPGRDKSAITHPSSTVVGLRAALALLRPGGILSIAVYRGQPGASAEAEVVEGWLDGLPRSNLDIVWKGRDGVPTHRPYVVCVRKLR